MRKIPLLLAAVTAIAAAAVASSAQAVIPPPGPDLGVAGGGYTLINPMLPNQESNRARFEFALRESQVDGSIRGKLVTVRVLGTDMVTKFVLRSWTMPPPPPPVGFPPPPAYPGGGPPGALVNSCSLMASFPPAGPAMLDFAGFFNVFVEPIPGVEVPYMLLPQIPYAAHMYDFGPLGGGMPDSMMMFSPMLPGGGMGPFTLPLGPLVAGNIGGIDGVKSPACVV